MALYELTELELDVVSAGTNNNTPAQNQQKKFNNVRVNVVQVAVAAAGNNGDANAQNLAVVSIG